MIMKIYCPVDEKETNIKPDGTCEQCDSDLTPLLRLLRLPQSYFEEALKLKNENRVEDAIERLIIAINLNKGHWKAHFELGNLYAQKGLYDDAIAHYNKAITLAPDDNEIIRAKENAEDLRSQAKQSKDNQIKKLKFFKNLAFIAPLVTLFIGLSILPISSQFNKMPVPLTVVPEKATSTSFNEQKVSPQQPVSVQSETHAEMFQYTVKLGDCFELIAYRFYGKRQMWKQIYEANKNKIIDPNNLEVGQVIGIPITSMVIEVKE
jgi:tetratricopeptide (TPR) repeat protein